MVRGLKYLIISNTRSMLALQYQFSFHADAMEMIGDISFRWRLIAYGNGTATLCKILL